MNKWMRVLRGTYLTLRFFGRAFFGAIVYIMAGELFPKLHTIMPSFYTFTEWLLGWFDKFFGFAMQQSGWF